MKKINRNFILLSIVTFILLLTSCDTFRTKSKPDIAQSNILYATLYNYYSAEYKALALQAYNLASERIKSIRKADPENDSLAVVLDLDETVLDNSPYQAILILENIEYDSLWNEWCNLAVARSIPGSLEFVRLADSLGFHVYYLSNRKEAYVLQGTIKNLQDLGFPQVEEKNMLLRKSTSDKEPRRKIIQEDYEICLLIGDNLGDFFTDAETPSERDEQVSKFADRFGENYIILPNAMYGNWVQSHSLFDDPRQTKILLDSMVKDFDIKLLEKSE